jgi:hypothetical protein
MFSAKKVTKLPDLTVPIVYCIWRVMIFMGVKIHFEGHWKGWALKIETFLGPEMATSEASAIWAQKSRDFQGPPLPMARIMDLPPSESLSPSTI